MRVRDAWAWLPRKAKGGKVLGHLSLAKGLSERWGKVSERCGSKIYPALGAVRQDSNPRSYDPEVKVLPPEPLPQFDLSDDLSKVYKLKGTFRKAKGPFERLSRQLSAWEHDHERRSGGDGIPTTPRVRCTSTKRVQKLFHMFSSINKTCMRIQFELNNIVLIVYESSIDVAWLSE